MSGVSSGFTVCTYFSFECCQIKHRSFNASRRDTTAKKSGGVGLGFSDTCGRGKKRVFIKHGNWKGLI